MMITSQFLEERIAMLLKSDFYYLDYPNDVPEGLWKNGDGNYVNLKTMPLDHLRNCIRRIENDLMRYDDRKLKDIAHQPVRDIVFPLAEQKCLELRAELRRQVEDI